MYVASTLLALVVLGSAAADAAPVEVTPLVARHNSTRGECNAGCVPKDVKKKDGQPLCCTEGRSTFACPGPARYQCGSAPASLWFRLKTGGTCGEINGATFVGPDLLQPKNANALAQYTAATLAFSKGLQLGRCDGYTVPSGSKQTSWDRYVDMSTTCRNLCQCEFPCKDVPDQPRKHQFCSLCGEKYDVQATVQIYRKPNLVQLAQSVPTLSTLVSAIGAADLTEVLSAKGPFTVFAPNNEVSWRHTTAQATVRFEDVLSAQ